MTPLERYERTEELIDLIFGESTKQKEGNNDQQS